MTSGSRCCLFTLALARGCLLLPLVLTFVTCNPVFEPKADFREQLVVFSILGTNRSEQVARVYTTYDPEGLDPSTNTSEGMVTNARVTLNDGTRSITMKDTLISRPDTTRYRTPMSAYAVNGLTLKGGETFTLTVESATHGSAVGSMTLPHHATLSVNGSRIIESGGGTDQSEQITITAYPGHGATGTVSRIYVDYEVGHPGRPFPGRIEVPERYPTDILPHIERTYPQLKRLLGTAAVVRFTKEAYQLTLSDALSRHPQLPVTFKRVVVVFLQAEAHLFAYYFVTNAFFDKGSIRTDQPNHSNISGGIGVFGGFTVDSLVYSLPDNFPFNRN